LPAAAGVLTPAATTATTPTSAPNMTTPSPPGAKPTRLAHHPDHGRLNRGGGHQNLLPDKNMQRFNEKFWFHPENRLDLRFESMAEELARSGDLFPLLFREKHTCISLLRFLTKDEILKIETRKTDWEKETAVIQATDDPTNPRR
jgi:hypothetical protein